MSSDNRVTHLTQSAYHVCLSTSSILFQYKNAFNITTPTLLLI